MQELLDSARSLASALGLPSSRRANAVVVFDGVITHPELISASKALYDNGHFAKAVEDGAKALVAQVQARAKSSAEGTSLMEHAFSVNNPLLRVNLGKSKADRDEQEGYMYLFKGAVLMARNPRVHDYKRVDSAEQALAILRLLDHLFSVVDMSTPVSPNPHPR